MGAVSARAASFRRLGNCSLWHGLISPQSGSILSLGYPELTSGLSMAHSSLVASGSTTGFSGNLSSNFCRMAAMKLFLILSRFCLPWRTWLPLNSSFAPDTVKCSLRSWCIWVCCEGSRDCRLDNAHLQCSTWTSTMLIGVGGAVRILVVGTIGKEETPRVSSGWSSVWHCSNTGLSSTQYEQIPIILGVWPFWLTPFFFRSITFWWDYGWIVFPLVKLLSFFWLTYYCSQRHGYQRSATSELSRGPLPLRDSAWPRTRAERRHCCLSLTTCIIVVRKHRSFPIRVDLRTVTCKG